MGTKKPWYHEGLRFTCSQCGDCCSGAPGYVWVNSQEIGKLASFLDMDREAFEKKFVRLIGIRKSLREHRNGDCVFLDRQTRACTVYSARPRQCRTWPFWNSNLKSSDSWTDTCEICPGSGKGKLYQLEEIEQRRNVMNI